MYIHQAMAVFNDKLVELDGSMVLAEDKTMQCIPVDIELQDGTDEVGHLKRNISSVSEEQGETVTFKVQN